jgi:broad specificity phosphatase PhoE
MHAPAITRQRRPFLAPLWVTMLAVAVAAGIGFAILRSASTTVIVLVPAGEKEPGAIDDPPISAEGEQRARRLAQMFGGDGAGATGRLDAVYVSQERRAQQTAAPLLDLLHLAPTGYAEKDAAETARSLLRAHEGGVVLVIGSAAALQQILAELTGAGTAAAPSQPPDLLYIVSVPSFGRPQVLRLRY